MEGIAGRVAIGKDERLLSLTWRPQILEQRSVPVDFIKYVWGVDPAGRAVLFAASSALAAWKLHILFIVIKTSGRVVARREVDVGTERRSETIAVLVREAHTGGFVVWVTNSDAMKTI
jgi:hypothetical protein